MPYDLQAVNGFCILDGWENVSDKCFATRKNKLSLSISAAIKLNMASYMCLLVACSFFYSAVIELSGH